MHILQIDTAPNFHLTLRQLEQDGHVISPLIRMEKAMQMGNFLRTDIIIMVVNPARANATDAIRQLRLKSDAPLVIITESVMNEQQQVDCLDLGADEVILHKSLSSKVFAARIRALYRRAHGPGTDFITVQDLTFDLQNNLVRNPEGQIIRLGPSQYKVLFYLARRQGKHTSVDELREHLYKGATHANSSIWVLITNIRNALERNNSPHGH